MTIRGGGAARDPRCGCARSATFAGCAAVGRGGRGDAHGRGVDPRGRTRRRGRGLVGRPAGARRGGGGGRGAPYTGRRAAHDGWRTRGGALPPASRPAPRG